MGEHHVELTACEFRAMGREPFRLMSEDGKILVVRRLEEIGQLRRHILDWVRACASAALRAEIEAFFADGTSPSDEGFAVLHHCLKQIRDSRYMGALFSSAVRCLGLPAPVLVDTGHFRMVFPQDHGRLTLRTDLFEIADFVNQGPNEPEVMLTGSPGRAHRDIDSIHYTFQVNFWFPLHDVSARESLILFPDVYRREVPYYQPIPDLDPATWGYGPALQIPLSFGDALVFHSQHFHASPTQMPERNRLSVELRAAGGCEDDNGRVYRGLFCNLRNFEPLAAPAPGGVDAAALAHVVDPAPAPGRDAIPEPVETPLSQFNNLFSCPASARRAMSPRSPDIVFADASRLGAKESKRLAAAFRAAPLAEDRQLALVRCLAYQQQQNAAWRTAADLLARTESYFWSLEVGRLAGAAGRFKLAARAFAKAEALARSSRIAIGQYAPGIPGRSNTPAQLLPPQALRAARFLHAKAAGLAEADGEPGSTLLDYRLFYVQPSVKRSFEYGDVIETGSLYVGLPLDRFYHPETIVDDPSGIAFDDSEPALHSSIHRWCGAVLAEARSTNLDLLCAYRGYNVVSYLHGIYCVPQRIGPVEFIYANPLDHEEVFVVMSMEAAKAAIDAALASGQE